MFLGAHMSIAGGYHKALEKAASLRMSTCQIFTKNNNQWRAKPITAAEAEQFRAKLDELKIAHPIAHSSYLINLATPDKLLWKKSIDSLVVEMLRAEQLGLSHVVVHPGAHTSASEAAGMKNVVRALNEMHAQTRGIECRCLLETTAGQGTCLGWRFEQLAAMLDGTKHPEKLGVCLDTCHVFAAGYPLAAPADYEATLRAFDQTVGLSRIDACHLNDSKRELGSRVDRHEHIGRGRLGLEPFRNLLNDPRLQHVPKYLETEKGTEAGEELDVINLRTLRGLVA